MTGNSTVLVTGAAGYIGSHTALALLEAGHRVVALDNLSNGSAEALHRVRELAGGATLAFEHADVRDATALRHVFGRHAIDGVIHFAALKAVGDSVAQPLAYYDNNVGGTVSLVGACLEAGVRRFVFSSSATVYGIPEELPFREDHRLAAVNPYGATKLMVEQILRDVCVADPAFCAIALRYFNPIGAHPSGRIGEDPHGTPNNLFPFITQVAVGRRPHLSVFGDDWPTVDGTGVRDYIHVSDLADGHVRALAHAHGHAGFDAINLGTGRGTSVRELVGAFERATGRPIPFKVAPRRPGDIAAFWSDPTRARQTLGWTAQRDIETACADGWRWQQQNPDGYGREP
jgi:UDP-glucose 4-epimerase